jgi:hypothetical protein
MNTADLAQIKHLIGRYIEGLYRCDVALLAQVLHPQALYATASSGQLLRRDMPDYFAVVQQRVSAASQGQPYALDVQQIESLGEHTALVRLACTIAPKHYQDILSLVKLEERWWIISKVFDYTDEGLLTFHA